jgi:hypothetical protein
MAHRMLIFRQGAAEVAQTAALPLLLTQRVAGRFPFDQLR